MYSRFLKYEVELQDGTKFLFNYKLLLNIFHKYVEPGRAFKKIVGSYNDAIQGRLRVIADYFKISDEKLRIAICDLPHDGLLIMFKARDIIIVSKSDDEPDSKKINVIVIGGEERVSKKLEDESLDSIREIEAEYLKELKPLTLTKTGCIIERFDYKENLEDENFKDATVDELPELDEYLMLANAQQFVFSHFDNTHRDLQPVNMTDLVELALRHGMPDRLRVAGGFKQISRYILNVDALVKASELYPAMKWDQFDASIQRLEQEKSLTVYYDQKDRIAVIQNLLEHLMQCKVVDHEKFSIPTDKSSLEIIKAFKFKIIKILELWNYNFEYWSMVVKPDFLAAGAILPSNNQDLIDQDSLFYLMMNHGTSGVNSKLHTVDQPTQSMRRLLDVLDLHRCAEAGRDYDAFARYARERKYQDEYKGMTIDTFDLNAVTVIAQDYNLQIKDIEDDACPVEKFKQYQEKILRVISENPDQDWVGMLSYRESQKQSTFSMRFFDSALPPEASIRCGLVFRIMNRDADRKTLSSPNKPTKAMKALLGVLKKQKLMHEKTLAIKPN